MGFANMECIYLKAENQEVKIIDLEKKLAIAKDALEFYGNKENWKTVTVSKSNQRFCILTGADLEYFQEPNQDSYCGKRAREVIKKLDE